MLSVMTEDRVTVIAIAGGGAAELVTTTCVVKFKRVARLLLEYWADGWELVIVYRLTDGVEVARYECPMMDGE